jgi:hypothetical protein
MRVLRFFDIPTTGKTSTGPDGFTSTPHFRWDFRQNPRPTAREEAIAAKMIEEANPRENIAGHYPWGPEQQWVLQQLFVKLDEDVEAGPYEWRDVPRKGADALYSIEQTEHGDLPIPDAVGKPGVIQGDFRQRIREALGEDVDGAV